MAIIIWNQWTRCPRWWRNCKRFLVWMGLLVALCPLGGATASAQQAVTTLLAVGDVANCDVDEKVYHQQTADLVDTLPGTIAIAGDIAYPAGSDEDFANCYDPAWGRHSGRVRPVPGNHEYLTAGAAGYFGYFGDRAAPLEAGCVQNCLGFYSYNLGEWHIIALNSEIDMAAGSTQEQWLRADLAANRNVCTLAYWHRPRFSSGMHSNDAQSADIWRALYDFGADVVVAGHEHNYERFAPQNPDGGLDVDRGIRQFVVGTGGVPQRSFTTVAANSEVRMSNRWGVLQFSLYRDHYTWEFQAIAGQEFDEHGSATCVRVEGDWDTLHFIPATYE